MNLFLALYLDEDVNILLAELLRARGFDVLTTRDAALLSQDDPDQLAFAAQVVRTFVTHNRADFEALVLQYGTDGRPHAGVIIAVRHPPYEVLRRLLIILDQVTADEMANQLYYI